MKKELNINELYRLKKSDLKKCAQIASLAFMSDESSKFLFSKSLTQKALYEYYLAIYNTIYEKMYMFADSEHINGFVIVSEVENAEISLFDFIKTNGLNILFKFGFNLLFRSLQYENNCVKIRKKFVSSGDWYVFQFGVNPESQNKGFGSKIMRPFLGWLDSNNFRCYLETQKDINVEIYKHFGFELKSINTLPKKCKKQYAMLRP